MMSLGFFKKTSKNKVVHRYENMPLPNARGGGQTDIPSRKQAAQYINVEFDDRNGRRKLARIGEERIQSKASGPDAGATTEGTDGGEPQQHKTTKHSKQKSRKGFRGSIGKAHRVHHIRDSDSSSSEMIESNSDRQDDKTSEAEHYNRLKLNLSSLPQNKKLLKGIRILYGDAVVDEGRQERSLQTALGSSLLFKERQQVHGSTEGRQHSRLEVEKRPNKMYKNERHANRLLSVTGGPVRCSPLAAPGSRALSQSASDISTLTIDDNEAYTYSRMAARRPKSLSDIETVRINITHDSTPVGEISDDDDSFVAPASPSQPHHNGSDLLNPLTSIPVPLPGLNLQHTNGNLLHQRKQSSKSSKFSTSVETQTTEEIGEVAMTKSELHMPPQQTAAFYGETCSGTCTASQIHFINGVERVSMDHNGGLYKSATHDITISLPKGAIKKHTETELQVGVTLHGPFTFPDTKQPVSAIVWVGLNPPVKLKKPLEITVPHFVEKSTQEGLVFLKVSDGGQTGKRRGNTYQFSHVTGNNQQIRGRGDHGTVTTKETGFVCIAGEGSLVRTNCCLLPVVPRNITQETWKIHYYLTYLLKTHINMVKCQMGQEWEILPPRKFNFASTEGTLEIQFQRELQESGWILSLESDSKIHTRELDLWGSSSINMEVLGMYPPSFTIRVHGEDAQSSSVANIQFLGASEELRTEIPLLRPRASTSTTCPSTPTSVFSPNPTSRNNSNSEPSSARREQASDTHGVGCQCRECSQIRSQYSDYDHLPSLIKDNTYMLTDDELFRVAAEITKILEDKWTALQEPLDIPDDIMLNVLSHRNTGQQVCRLLKEWSAHTGDCTREGLARCLYQADKRLQHIGHMLQVTA